MAITHECINLKTYNDKSLTGEIPVIVSKACIVRLLRNDPTSVKSQNYQGSKVMHDADPGESARFPVDKAK
jgi:hypothetical protein